MHSLSIVLPAHNEEANVDGIVHEVLDVVQKWTMDYEIILVNDGSTDRTGEIARMLLKQIPQLRLVEHFPSRHYGGALKAGFAAATKELIAFLPADRQFVFSEIDRLLDKMNDADIVSGCRTNRRDNLIRRCCGFSWNVLVRVLFGYLCQDIDCGFKLFRREILEHVKLITDGNPIDTELLAGAKARGYRIAEVQTTHLPRTAGKAKGVDFMVALRAFRDLPLFRLRLSRELLEERRKHRTR